MEYRTALLQLARVGDALRVGLYERNGSSENTLRPFEVHSVSWDQVDAECRELLALLNRANRDNSPNSEALSSLKRSGGFLFDLLLPQSVKTKLANSTSHSLTLELDDSLIHVPWQLLYDGREFLCRRFAMGRIVNTRQASPAQSQRKLKPPVAVLILADPRGDLAAAYREGVALRNFLDERRDLFHVDFKSCPVDVTFVKKILREYDIVHYAGHAIYHAEDPAESGWLLRDGALTAGGIASMGGPRPMPALVFANACQSGHADGSPRDTNQEKQIAGLASAFLVAGVRHYVGSFGDIVDEAGGVFAKDFYAVLAEGNTIGMALRQARLVSIARFGETQLNWSRYMLYGAPDFELASNSEGLSTRYPMGDDYAHSYALRGTGTDEKVEVKKPRTRMRVAASLAVATIGLLGYSFFHWQRDKKQVDPPAALSASVMNVSAVSNSLPQVPLSLSMQVIGQRKEADRNFTEIIIREGVTLRSGDQFQVHVKLNRSAYVYIILYDSRGQASKLFPDPKIEQPDYVAAHDQIAIPDKHLWFWLDNHPGTETIYALASAEPLKNIAELLAKMEGVQTSLKKSRPIQFRERLKSTQRGVGGLAQANVANLPAADDNVIKQVTAIVAASGAVVRALSFRHE